MKNRASKKKGIHLLNSLMPVYQKAMQISDIQWPDIQWPDMQWDPQQLKVLETFEKLAEAIFHYIPHKNGVLSLFSKKQRPKGIYLWGDVGRGKTFIMDLFFERVVCKKKQRVHFHRFMQEVHSTLHKMPENENGLEVLAKNIAEKSILLCFDEFQVTNIADAMIMKRLFEALFNEGVVIVATANTAPESLYLKGLHRDRFLPFIDTLLEYVQILHLDGKQDYRRLQVEEKKRYFSPVNNQSQVEVESIWKQLTGGELPEELEILANGRVLKVPAYARRIGRFHFKDLCGQPLGAADYLALVEELTGLILEGIPILSSEDQDEAHRLQTLVDILYDNGILLVASGEGPLEQLYVEGKGVEAFKRTVSRLHEMCHG